MFSIDDKLVKTFLGKEIFFTTIKIDIRFVVIARFVCACRIRIILRTSNHKVKLDISIPHGCVGDKEINIGGGVISQSC